MQSKERENERDRREIRFININEFCKLPYYLIHTSEHISIYLRARMEGNSF